jgi:hypothetical protein
LPAGKPGPQPMGAIFPNTTFSQEGSVTVRLARSG